MFWADEVVNKAIKQYGTKSHLISTGITPSGHIHFGHAMEVFVADTVRVAFQTKKIKPRLIYIHDDFDHLRKIPKGISKEFEKYLGTPLIFVPDPEGDKQKNFVERFLNNFFYALDNLELDIEKISQYELYKSGKMTDVVSVALENKTKIKEILERVSNRKLDKNWNPVTPLCEKCNKLGFNNVLNFDISKHIVTYQCECGHKGQADYSRGQAKLVWRVDWPAKWKVLNVTVEPFGKDHAVSGGSYESGKEISEKIFHRKAPIPVPYENIHLKGVRGKMSSSVGNVVSLKDAVDNFPPEALRYLIMRKKPNRHLIFDPGEGLLQVIDEITKLGDKTKIQKFDQNQIRAYELAKTKKSRINISFRHLINAIQAAQGNINEIIRILKRSGHLSKAYNKKALDIEIKRAQNWLKNYAPESVKFEIQKTLPNTAKNLTEKQKQLLVKLINKLQKNIDAEVLHNFIYDTGKSLGLTAVDTFTPIYSILLGKKSGPKVGWFLSILDRDFLIKRLKEATKK
ncbi:MAG: lysine--tRNA ligase [bacterium]